MSSRSAGAFTVVCVCLAAGALSLARHELHRTRSRRRLGGVRTKRNIFASNVGFVAHIAIPVVVVVLSPRLLLVTLPVQLLATMFVRDHLRSRRRAAYEKRLPMVLESLSGSVRSGASLVMAIEEAGRDLDGPVAKDMAHLASEVKHGVAFEDAMARWKQRRDTKSVRLVASSLSLAHRSGAAHAQVIDGVAVSLRRSLDAVATAKTNASQSQASAFALSVLPLVFTGPMVVIDASVREFLFYTWPGVVVLALGVTLDGLGALWMARLIRKATT